MHLKQGNTFNLKYYFEPGQIPEYGDEDEEEEDEEGDKPKLNTSSECIKLLASHLSLWQQNNLSALYLNNCSLTDQEVMFLCQMILEFGNKKIKKLFFN